MSLLIQNAKNVKNAVTMTQLLYKNTDTREDIDGETPFVQWFIYYNINHNYYKIRKHVMVQNQLISPIKKMKSKE